MMIVWALLWLLQRGLVMVSSRGPKQFSAERSLVWCSLSADCGGRLVVAEIDEDARISVAERMITEELAIVRAVETDYLYCPSAENKDAVERAWRQLDRLIDRRSNLRAATIPAESPAPRSVVSS